ncbi:uncharacterized protein DSM5745_05111 [Aspergillus mulundensis]|uniref:Rhodopsin domain-containing protein n=1 Tax=Aspergillus mulundensis TaxID=1810919 RepID=A0A3D8S6B9_9EURO|nr:hypothetical protein DSM5745_05111 [Aspergillus mulundensis]RDW81554.1 hypothetical protein DSM5745_05111 [Aspergillus mulundensis]
MPASEASISPERMAEYSGDRLRDVAIAFTVLEFLAVGLRFISVRIGHEVIGLDDYLAVPGLLCCLALNTAAFVGIHVCHLGYHLDFAQAIEPDVLVTWSKISLAVPILYSAACAVPWIMLLIMYLRILSIPWLKPYRMASYALMTIQGGHCIDVTLFYRWGSMPNILIDIAMLFLP